MNIRKTALWLVFAGLLFAFVRLPFMGIDLLIDAVGYLLVFNGVRTLRKLDGTYLLAVPLSLVLVAVCAAEMVASEWAPWPGVLRALCEMVFFASLLLGLGRWDTAAGYPGRARVGRLVLALSLVAPVAHAWAVFGPALPFGPQAATLAAMLVPLAHLTLLGLCLWHALRPAKAMP